MNVVFLGLGGNLGNRQLNLQEVIAEIGRTCGEILMQSSVYETEAWGSSSANKYLNMVVKVKTELSAQNLIQKLNSIEEVLGRKRSNDRNSDRIMDIDILFFNHEVIESETLEIPHPRLHLRKFVLIPLFEIAKEFQHPILKQSVEQLLLKCPDTLEVIVFA